jgi:hypothetical protein
VAGAEVNKLTQWIVRRIVMKKIKAALAELIGNTSERTAVLASAVLKAACLYAPLCAAMQVGTSYLGMTPETLVGALLTYAGLRFASKLQKAEPAPVK